jgi:hypothetical protein
MVTAISRGAAAGLVALAVAALAGCGATSGPGTATSHVRAVSPGTATTPAAVTAASSFAWLAPSQPPAGWPVATIPSGAAMPYPPNWRPAHGDKGTATAVSLDRLGHIVGYLNVTPRQGAETLSNWRMFRVEHNADEGERNVRRLAAASGLRFRSGSGSCVKDSYTTSSGTHYVELACLVRASVIVGAAPSRDWARMAPLLQRSIAAFRG